MSNNTKPTNSELLVDKENISSSDISNLLTKITDLEDTINHITEQQADLTHKVKEQKNTIEDQNNKIKQLKQTVENQDKQIELLQKENQIKNSQLEHINKFVDRIDNELSEENIKIKELKSEYDRRMKAIETLLDVNETDIAKAIKPGACELEQLATIPEDSRLDELNVRTTRAVSVYENFDQISDPIKNGSKRLLSKDIKTFLSGRKDGSISYSQVHRVIDTFDEKTDKDYKIIQTDDGRAILWDPNDEY